MILRLREAFDVTNCAEDSATRRGSDNVGNCPDSMAVENGRGGCLMSKKRITLIAVALAAFMLPIRGTPQGAPLCEPASRCRPRVKGLRCHRTCEDARREIEDISARRPARTTP